VPTTPDSGSASHEDAEGPNARDDLGELWSWGAEASQAMSERVLTLYRDLGSSALRLASGDLEAELGKVRLDVERLADLSFDVFDRFLAVLRRVVDENGAGGTTTGELLALRAVPGDTASADVWVHNASTEAQPAPRLHLPGLATVDGASIAPSRIRVSASLVPIDGGNSRRMTLAVDVPPRARRGMYHGVLISDGAVESAMLVRLEVVSATSRDGGKPPG
jgi:hypothetical protein